MQLGFSLKPQQQTKISDAAVTNSTAHYLRLLVLSFLFHLVESLQHPAKVSNAKFKTDFFVVLLLRSEKQFPEFWVDFSFFFRRELFSFDDNTGSRGSV